jgi:hypothetical protein
VIGGHDQQGVRPVDVVAGALDVGDDRPDGLVEAVDRADELGVVALVSRPVDVTALEHGEEAGVAAGRQHLERRGRDGRQ